MPKAPAADSGTYRPYTKAVGDEPLPGYKLLAPLGRGGFGEVWKCEAPGGLHKAIKFVISDSEDGRGGERFGQELAAFEQIKAIRHPFLLTLERVEQIAGDLIMVMELADRQLQDRLRECQTCGLPGVPRDELLAYFADAAEALDVIGAKFNLQHLDVKPANLFLVSGHVKVGDYGLVAQLEGPDAGNRGLTPRYVAPEVLHGTPSSCSDQYSLALVYHELLTGGFPYSGRTPQQMMLQHVSAQPNLTALPPCDQPAVGRALAKTPEQRFPSCLAFVQALMAAGVETALPAAAMTVRRARVDRAVAEMTPPPVGDDPGDPGSASGRSSTTQSVSPRPTQNFTLPAQPTVTVPAASPLPPLVSGNPKPLVSGNPKRPAQNPRLSTGAIPVPAPQAAVEFTPSPLDDEPEVEAGLVVLDAIRSVVPVARLLGADAPDPHLDAAAFAAAVVQAAAGGGPAPHAPGDVTRHTDGTWACQFPSTVPATVVPLKLGVVRESWGFAIEQPDPTQVLLRRTAGGGGFFSGKKFGYEVSVILPTTGKLLGEIAVHGRLFGTPDAKFARESLDLVPKVLAEVRGQLNNVADRRKHPRLACELGLTLYPVHSDGSIDAAVPVKCRDVSVGGVGFDVVGKVQTKYVYAAFEGVAATAGLAVLVRLVRVQNAGGERSYGAQYRTDL